jgi:hypothetical protein
MSHPSPLRFFRVSLQQPAASMAVFMLLLVAGGAWTAVYDADDFDQVCLLALVFQMFASSTGFREQARRGHFDPILARGTRRFACARAHWLLSIAPGLVVWLALAVIAWRLAPARSGSFFSASAICAAVYVSTLSWTITLPFQRYVGAVAWFALIFTLAAGHQLHSLREAFLMSSGNWRDTLALTGAVLIAPVFLVANPDVAGSFALAVVAGASAALWAAGAMFIAAFDGVLRDPS